MSHIEFKQQSDFYDKGYFDYGLGSLGFPDYKIIDNDLNVTNKRILNIGGGNSADLWFLSADNFVEVLDGSSVAIAQAQEHGVKGQVADIAEPLPYDDAQFHIVVLKDILEHVYNPLAVLMEAKRVLRDDGYMIISLPNHFYLPFRLRMFFGGNLIWKSIMHNHKKDFNEWDYMHIRFFTWAGVKKFIKVSGLFIEKGYWDFGTLAHYSDPVMYARAFTLSKKNIITRKQWLLYRVLVPLYQLFNIIVPRKFRSWLVGLCPGLLCAGFYIRVRKDQ